MMEKLVWLCSKVRKWKMLSNVLAAFKLEVSRLMEDHIRVTQETIENAALKLEVSRLKEDHIRVTHEKDLLWIWQRIWRWRRYRRIIVIRILLWEKETKIAYFTYLHRFAKYVKRESLVHSHHKRVSIVVEKLIEFKFRAVPPPLLIAVWKTFNGYTREVDVWKTH